MKAVVFHAIGAIRVDDVPEPVIEQPSDAIVRLTASAICGTDLQFVRGTFSGVEKGQILGHEGIGIVEAIGPDVSDIAVGQRVIIPSTIGCGHCQFCENEFYAQCDNANPGGKLAGTAFFGGPAGAGGYKGLQAEKARVPWADVNLVPIPDAISDDQAIMMSDNLPTAWFGADLAEIEEGDHVLIFGCGPVGQMAIASAKLMGGRVIEVDSLPDRLAMAARQGAETINFDEVEVKEAVLKLTGGDGARRVIDAVGVDAQHAGHGPEASVVGKIADKLEQYVVEPSARKFGKHYVAGNAPSQVLEWAVDCVAKGGTISIIGVYPPTDNHFPNGQAMNKNVTLRMGNANHRRYYDVLIEHVLAGRLDPAAILTQVEPASGAIDAYKAFDERQPGWIKVELEPAA